MLFNDIVDCNLCGLRSKCFSPVPVNYIKNSAKKILVVASHPSKEEDNLQMAWCDRHSLFIKKEIQEAFKSYPINFTYLVKCHCSVPSQIGIKTCGVRWLSREIQYSEPKLIISMGKTSHKGILDLTLFCGKLEDEQDILETPERAIAFCESPHKIFSGGKFALGKLRNTLTKSREVFERNYHVR